MKKEDYFVQEDRCPRCKHIVDSGGLPSGERVKPTPGDFSVCINCGTVNRYDGALFLEELTDEDFNALPAEEQAEIRKVQSLVAAVNRKFPRR